MSDPVNDALASGEWKEKKDPKSGRTFYVHTHSKRSVWNLEKELKKQTPTTEGGNRPIDGMQADEIAAAEERAKISREERQAKMQVRAQAELKLREDIERLEQANQVLEMEISNLRGPAQAEAAQVAELRRILADHQASLHDVESELGVKREQKNAELLQLQNRIGLLEAQLASEEQFRDSIRARYDKMTAENLELRADLSREESVALQLHAQMRETETKTQQLKARLQLQRAEINSEEESIKLVEDDVRAISVTKTKLEGEISRRQKEMEQAKKRRADEQAAAKLANTDARTTQAAIKNLEQMLTARERELTQLMEADTLLEKNGAYERANGNLRAVLKAAIRDEEALQKLSELLERENQILAEAIATARDQKQKVDTVRRQFRYKYTTSDPQGEFSAMCTRWAALLSELGGIL